MPGNTRHDKIMRGGRVSYFLAIVMGLVAIGCFALILLVDKAIEFSTTRGDDDV